MENNRQIALTILQQLGGIFRLQAMTGAHTIVSIESGCSFKFSCSEKFNYCKVVLTWEDLYDVTFMKLQKLSVVNEVNFKGLDFEKLCPTFEEQTGLVLSL